MILLDTHALLWALMEPEKLSDRALETLQNPTVRLFVSSASAWELSIKHALGKLGDAEVVLEDFAGHLERLQADVLPITLPHALAVGALPHHHRDPFDRMLIAQARLEGLSLISNDAVFAHYDAPVIW